MISHGLRAGTGAIEWVVAGYGLTTALFVVTGGRLGDLLGRRRVFVVGLAGFVVTSAACALAPDAAVLVASRLAQGGAAALMAPNVLSLLGVIYTGPDRLRAISISNGPSGWKGRSGSTTSSASPTPTTRAGTGPRSAGRSSRRRRGQGWPT